MDIVFLLSHPGGTGLAGRSGTKNQRAAPLRAVGLVLLRLLVPVQLFTVPVAGESIPAISSLPEQRLEIEPEYIQPTQPIPEKETNVVTGAAMAGQPMPETCMPSLPPPVPVCSGTRQALSSATPRIHPANI